ncbi:hypothetical protein HMN09_00537400 [Mycena chlorophos]|uniref:Glycosyl transferase CAP10 domain-containing protein n=1 Tax=Mycena chlorophos TaxID=658473 RepID=A0A8H6WEN3_MYCCL|nr:hypothetical protein HMN09_00537400 [Mycena chlorophos]
MRRDRALRVLLVLAVALAIVLYLRGTSTTDELGIDASTEYDATFDAPKPWNRPEHAFLPNGLVQTNPDAPHPIYELIANAEGAWRDKLARASTTFTQAVTEYRRRYKRSPPKGFDLWWDYVREHAVQLPDEYDQLHDDLEPFWGIEPKDLLATRSELEGKADSYTIGKTATTPVAVVNTSFAPGKYDQLIHNSKGILDLLRDIEDDLPPFRAVFSPHDGPNRMSDYFLEQAARQAAAEKRYLRWSDLPKIDPAGWKSACPPGSPSHNLSVGEGFEPPPPTTEKTFIFDHNLAMNPCLHPRHFWYNSLLLNHNRGPTPQHQLLPEFAQCSTHMHHNIRIPTPYGWIDDIPRNDDPPWDEKPDERVLWRGSNTGTHHTAKSRWRTAQRPHLMQLTNDIRGMQTILSPNKGRAEPVGQPITVRKARLNPGIFDVAFAGDPMMCDPETCTLLQKIFPWRKRQSVKEAGEYRYVIDVDGNGWSGRFKRLITSNSLVFKATIFPEWWLDRVQPWVHYVPVQLDLSDLHDVVVFFRGDASGLGAHEDLARRIAEAGRTWSKRFWRREDLIAYFYRLILEYARLMSEDRDAMTYKHFS